MFFFESFFLCNFEYSNGQFFSFFFYENTALRAQEY